MIQVKRLLMVSGVALGLVACHSNPNQSNTVAAKVDSQQTSTVTMEKSDTVGLAAFRAQQQARYEDSLKNVGAMRERERRRARATTTYASSGTRSSYAASGYGANTTTTTRKKSHAARNGALIGAGAGALTGALVTKKNRGVGALIGGVAGGAAGYGVGKIVEKKKENQ
ncbi:glycine zipper domain-containing protein [uncultured Mucilaginibacter sp.]|uniref:glycine zipper domain-containing protein n=1 Tax=uncultured Mucilaginibacter sp. TaxID=797541 RepID=UPI0025FF98D2|nr:glycine zipper domain-containing protein [uncultured Mucilaginibacter sp.]